MPGERSGYLESVMESTNAFRAEHGLRTLELNERLNVAAQEYAERMARDGFFDHHSPVGDGPGERISAAGYGWLNCGENIAVGYGEPGAVMKAWIDSPVHRANLLNGDYIEVGLGYAIGRFAECEGECPFWVQEFCLPLK